MAMTVAKKWGQFQPLTVNQAELDAITAEPKTATLVWRTRGLVLHPVTTNEFAYKKVAEMRGEPWPENTPSFAKDRFKE